MRSTLLTASVFALLACSGGSDAQTRAAASDPQQSSAQSGATIPSGERPEGGDDNAIAEPFKATPVANLAQPWAMTFLPDGRMLVTQKTGELLVVTQEGVKLGPVTGTPEVDYGGQGGLGDVALHPDFENNHVVYLSFVEAGEDDTRGAAVGRGELDLNSMSLKDFEVVWRQSEKVEGRGHFSHRIVFSPDGQYMFVSSGERQKFDPAQDMSNNLGSILRLNPDGTAAEGNPFADQGSPTDQIWSYGHRNILGLAFGPDGTLWEHEMGPKGGDEFQRIEEGENYGYPIVSNGDHYDGRPIPNHDTRPEFRAPDEFWNPVISPSSLIIYTGDRYEGWQNTALIGGLSSQALVHVTFDCELDGREICESERFQMDNRIREVEQGPDGLVWLLEDNGNDDGEGGRLLRLDPVQG
ncbi:PQQ-dependent sugar dehydrogenase [Parvularcula dongshanensis]|uniref:Glucose/arabinose dehydrogenase n=1 Tax=Parvularcula dongshanensis TaxID=1173995 RepID=A0A840I1P9_9PROT|nr:PQQ-dependent sugar dehydrogenase [Parvularcula dongshanensis]MBB4658118.1 glucose/arabinose dehydrogenase [Parvularcula dongshanensis]